MGIGGIACGATKYMMSTDAWKNTATTAADKNTDCCTNRAKCGDTGVACPAGMKMKTGVATTLCTSDIASCAVGNTCCENDPLKCGGIGGIACAGTQYMMSTDAWKNTATTAANKNTDCCTAKATCSAFSTYTPPSPTPSSNPSNPSPGTGTTS